jgi:predicted Zn finger-like uncharacterized protein
MDSMHIECINCRKIFEIEENLIPKNGRLLQCGNCDHRWFYKNKKKEIKEAEIEENIKEKIEITPNEDTNSVKSFQDKKKEKKSINIFKLFLVIVISFVALIIFIDTFKLQIQKYLPEIEVILNNLYQSLLDVTLFFKDLIK